MKWEGRRGELYRAGKIAPGLPLRGCIGERDVMGQLHKGPDKPLSPRSFQLARIELVGGYAVQPYWADGHSSGLFSFDYLRQLTG